MGNNTIDDGGGGENNPPIKPQRDVTWEEAGDDPEKLARASGFLFIQDPNNGDYLFNDIESGLELRVESDVIANHGNDGYLNEIVKSVAELPLVNRQATPAILIVNNDDTPLRGLHGFWQNPWNKLGDVNSGNHIVMISTSSIKPNLGKSFMRTLLHETEHAHDYMMGDYNSIGGISNSKAFKNALKEEGPATYYGESKRYKRLKNGNIKELSDSTIFKKDHNYLLENYAESASIVKMQLLGHGNEFVQLADGRFTTVKDWCATHPKTTKVISDNMGDTRKDFIKKESYYNNYLKNDLEGKAYGIYR